jgi:hypothetical protein
MRTISRDMRLCDSYMKGCTPCVPKNKEPHLTTKGMISLDAISVPSPSSQVREEIRSDCMYLDESIMNKSILRVHRHLSVLSAHRVRVEASVRCWSASRGAVRPAARVSAPADTATARVKRDVRSGTSTAVRTAGGKVYTHQVSLMRGVEPPYVPCTLRADGHA